MYQYVRNFYHKGIQMKLEEYLTAEVDALRRERLILDTKIETLTMLKMKNFYVPARDGKFSTEDITELLGNLRKGMKVNALKFVREITGLGLKEAKDYVDSLDFIKPASDEKKS